MFRPSAKSLLLSTVILVLSLLTVMLYLYISVTLETPPKNEEILVSFDRGSFIKTDIVSFFVKSAVNENNYRKYEREIRNSLGTKGSNQYLKKNVRKLYYGNYNKCSRSNGCVLIYIPLSEISSAVWRGLIGIEDSRFLTHGGVDWRSVVRAIFVNLKAGRIVQGGSTLTQQLVKNKFLSSERTYVRKLKEAIYSYVLELKYSKKELIESYLNTVYWGSFKGLKIYGIKAASLFYFGKHPNDLDEYEASILIGMLKGPSLYSPFNSNKGKIIKRSNLVYEKLVNDKLFTGKDSPWTERLWKNYFNFNFTDRYYLLRSLIKINRLSIDEFLMTFFLEKKIGQLSSLYPKADFAYEVVGLNKTKQRLSLSSRKSIASLTKNIGSLLKPIAYSELFSKFDENEKFDTSKFTLKLKSGPWTPKDHHHGKKSVTLSYALQKSLNIPFLRAASIYGFDKLEVFFKSKIETMKTPLSEYPSQLLGAIELTVSDMLDLYHNFLNKRCSDERVAKVIEILSVPKNTTTSKWVGSLENAKFFGKTGTSNNGYDNWYVYSDTIDLFVIWIGHVGKRDIGRLALSGGGVSFDVMRDFLTSRAKNIGQNICDE